MYECPRMAVGTDWSKVYSIYLLNTCCMMGSVPSDESIEMNKNARCHSALQRYVHN